MTLLSIVLLNSNVMNLVAQEHETKNFVDIQQIRSLEPKATGLAYFINGKPVLMTSIDGEIEQPEAGWPDKLYVYKPGAMPKELEDPEAEEEVTIERKMEKLEGRLKAVEGRLKAAEEELVELKKNKNSQQDEPKRKAQRKNLSKWKFQTLCQQNDCPDSFTYNDDNYKNWKQSGGGASFVPHHDKPSGSHSRHQDRWGDNSYHSYNNNRDYYGN